MNKKYYIAYGSNLNLTQMKRRCPDAKFIGTGMIDDFQLVFKGDRDNAYATVEPCVDAKVPAGIFEITEGDEANLDVYEGYPRIYSKKEMYISNGTEKMKAMIYVMNIDFEYGLPSHRYFHTVRQGYQDCHLDERYLDEALQNMMDRVQNQTMGEKYPLGYRDIRQ